MQNSLEPTAARPTTAQVLLRATLFGWAGSLLVHLLSIVTLLAVTTPPPPAFELTFPIDVELGLTEATEVSAPAGPEAPGSESSENGTGAGSGGSMDAGVPLDGSVADGSVGDGSVGDAARDGAVDVDAARRRRRRDAGVDAPAALVASGDGEGEGAGGDGDSPVAFLPAGAQVALRADLDLARSSPVRAEVEELLAALPDWRILLGSDVVQPVRDFSRVLIATPNFDRARMVVAGRLTDGAMAPREMADALAVARGSSLTWEESDGVLTTPWLVDDTARSLAIVGPRHFVVARDQDLARVLAIAAARTAPSEAGGAEAGGEAPPEVIPADALLSMRDREAVSLEVEGVRHFARRSPCLVPLTFRIGMTTLADETGVGLEAEARFASAEDASSAAGCLDDLRAQYARNALVAALGFARPLADLRVEADEARVLAHGGLTYGELRRILGMVRGLFMPRPAPGAPAAPPARDGLTPAEPPPVEPPPEADPG